MRLGALLLFSSMLAPLGAGAQVQPDAALNFATGFAAGHAMADSVDGYAADALIGLGTGVLVGALDASDQERAGRTRRDLYIRGIALGGITLLLTVAFAEWGTDPSAELLAQQPDQPDHRAGFTEGYGSRLAARHRIGAVMSTLTFLLAHGIAVAWSTEPDGTTYPLFSVHVPVP